jgi:hypothetical protein
MNMGIEAFTLNGTTISLSVTDQAPTPTAFTPTNGRIRVYNSGAVTVFLRSGIGSSDGTATTSHTPIAPGTVESFSVPTNHTYISGRTSSGSATVYITVGDGL